MDDFYISLLLTAMCPAILYYIIILLYKIFTNK